MICGNNIDINYFVSSLQLVTTYFLFLSRYFRIFPEDVLRIKTKAWKVFFFWKYLYLHLFFYLHNAVNLIPSVFSTPAHLSGTKKPNSACDVMFYGANSSPRGVIRQPGASLLWNMEGPLSCSYLMVPAVNQSLTLNVSQTNGCSRQSMGLIIFTTNRSKWQLMDIILPLQLKGLKDNFNLSNLKKTNRARLSLIATLPDEALYSKQRFQILCVFQTVCVHQIPPMRYCVAKPNKAYIIGILEDPSMTASCAYLTYHGHLAQMKITYRRFGTWALSKFHVPNLVFSLNKIKQFLFNSTISIFINVHIVYFCISNIFLAKI